MKQAGLILKGVGGLYTVRLDSGEIWFCKARGIFRKSQIAPLAGDRVEVSADHEAGKGIIDTILPRRNSLIRPRMANIDQLVIVSSMAEPAMNSFILDKMTAVAVSKQMEPIVVITKFDLMDGSDIAAIYHKIGMKCLCVDQSSDLMELVGWLRGKVSAFTGNSGVGKSTLLSRLLGTPLETGSISRKLDRGRHTTRQVELFPLANGYVADTPGFSTLDIERYERILRSDLPDCFPEMAPYRLNCRFSTCTHRSEPGCGVRMAVESGAIPRSRYESYCRMDDEVKDLPDWALDAMPERKSGHTR